MSDQTTPPPAEPQAIETDVAAIEAAMRKLTLLAVIEEQKLFDADGNRRAMPETEIGRAIANPVGEACHATWKKIFGLLVLLVGEQAATETQNRINSEMPSPFPPAANQGAFPSMIRH